LRGSVAGRLRRIGRRAAPLLLSGGVAFATAGCGASHSATPAAMRVERTDLITVCHTLSAVEPAVASEVAATKAAWPSLINGLPPTPTVASRALITTAAARATALRIPVLFEERQSASLTGRSATVAGLFRTYSRLAMHSWMMVNAAIAQVEHGPPVAARFASANVALYIESIYDAHFTLAQIGKQLLTGYKNLGGATAFGGSLTQAQVNKLAGAFSEPSDRLYPHAAVRLGS
jgi:hypothetical protein